MATIINPCITCKAHESTIFKFNVRTSDDYDNGKLDLVTSAPFKTVGACYESEECSEMPLKNCAAGDYCEYNGAMFLEACKELSPDNDSWKYAAVELNGRYYHAACLVRCARCRDIGLHTSKFQQVCPEAPWKPIRPKFGRGAHYCDKCETRCHNCMISCIAECHENVPVELDGRVHTQCHDYLIGCKKQHGWKAQQRDKYTERTGKTLEQLRGKRPDESEAQSAKRVK